MIQQYLEVGTIVTTHGVHGEVKILPWADGPEFLTLFDRVYLQGKEYPVENSRVQKTCVLMKLKGIDTVEAAQALRDQVVKVDRNDVELEEGTYFISDLIGLKVLCDDEELGVVKDIMTLPGNDVYVVKGEHEYMIPGVKEFIKEIDPGAGFIRVKLIEGMRTDAD